MRARVRRRQQVGRSPGRHSHTIFGPAPGVAPTDEVVPVLAIVVFGINISGRELAIAAIVVVVVVAVALFLVRRRST